MTWEQCRQVAETYKHSCTGVPRGRVSTVAVLTEEEQRRNREGKAH
ncbi:hypothetical protein GMOD_00010022 [Pyrenophora seminiperda CCB06]|uniref:Uncharacterized protein n=1 Tax=Pyrenophora seminiperda CCB06 TaxID=1302712 RepID=A0A3M7M1L3_9PLEO|nr:hypothetical protein GMOD_00010022 [Pyrenophora seminiperda CCB06]